MAQRVAPAVVSGVDSAEGEIRKAIDYVQAGVDELSGVVRQRPATSLFCAALAGYVLAAALSLRGRLWLDHRTKSQETKFLGG